MVSYAEMKEIQRIKDVAHIGPGTHNPHKGFGEEVTHKMHFGGKYKWKPDANPPPGLYDVNSNVLKPNAPSVKLENDRSTRSDFTRVAMQENPSSGQYQTTKDFGSDIKTKINMGSKYPWKPDSNPPPGLYDIDKAASMTKPKTKTARVGTGKRSDFTKTAQMENPSGGQY